MATFKTTSKEVAIGGQDVKWVELLNYGDYRLRMSIRSDAYQGQCHAHLEVFDKGALKWNIVVYRPSATMATEPKLVYHPQGKVKWDLAFGTDRKWLLDQFKNLVD